MSDGSAINWPNFNGTAQLVGTSPSGRVTVYVDPTLGGAGIQNAQDLLDNADRIVVANDNFFGTTAGSVNVIVFAMPDANGNPRTDGAGGADHAGCDYVNGNNLEVDASFGNSARVVGLFEAELSECNMGGNLCGVSTGEALSRWCAAVVSDNALADFASAPTWFNNGMNDWVNNVDLTDRSYDSTGCGMAFISWLLSQGYTLSAIAQGMVALGSDGTLAQLYGNLTNDDPANAWSNFQAAVNELGGVTTDDPFGGMPTSGPALAALHNPRSHRLLPS
jgi:hypothetical protein